MEALQGETEQKVHIEIENEPLKEGYNSQLVPEMNLKEPEPKDPILKWAERNIDENPNTKLELIEELRDMIFERGECEPYRTDDAFLLRFLRARHFIVRMAHRLFVNYHTFREENPNYFSNINYRKLMEVGESEIFSVPPYSDEDGRRILILRIENWDTAQFTTEDLFQAIIFLAQAAIVEPKHQILGGICIFDVGNLATGHAWYLTPSLIKNMIAVGYSCLPHRAHAVHVVNVSKIFDYAFSLLKPFLSEIMRERIFIHQDFESLHKHVSPKHLPKRYGGVHKDYPYNDWLSFLKDNEDLIDELESYGYEGGREFLKNI